MTREEAIKIIEVAKAEVEWEAPLDYQIAFDMAIEALKQPEHQMSDATENLKDLIMEVFDMRPSTAEKCIAILDDIKAIIENEEEKRTKNE